MMAEGIMVTLLCQTVQFKSLSAKTDNAFFPLKFKKVVIFLPVALAQV